MCGTTHRIPRQTEVRLVEITSFQVASSISSTTPEIARAALLTRMSTRPKAPSASSVARLRSAMARTSGRTNKARAPKPSSSAAVLGPSSASTSATVTPAPARARAKAQARPMPWAAPVTMAARPSSSPIGLLPPEPGLALLEEGVDPLLPIGGAVEAEQNLLLQRQGRRQRGVEPDADQPLHLGLRAGRQLQHGAGLLQRRVQEPFRPGQHRRQAHLE